MPYAKNNQDPTPGSPMLGLSVGPTLLLVILQGNTVMNVDSMTSAAAVAVAAVAVAAAAAFIQLHDEEAKHCDLRARQAAARYYVFLFSVVRLITYLTQRCPHSDRVLSAPVGSKGMGGGYPINRW
ncbi:hypothetical protein PoB_005826500 [Plakobranchus ocellatus]|uniref:Uncharacterized protein n=1 Tax=Plakobranchus ocellatus TaxID=259542 RepID=A0AAV4CIX0_9GAST|nr:hypothetical protein PoB_005826500 [Plakobranchus ocellatus]